MATQQNPWDNDPIITPAGGGAAPRGPVYGAPVVVDPYKARDQSLQEDAAARAAEKDRRDKAEWDASHNPDGSPKAKPTEIAKLPPTAAAGIQENIKTLRGIDEAISALKARPESIGTGTGMLGDTFTQWHDPEGTSTRSAIGKVGAYTIHDLSGAAVSASEAPRFTPFVPTVSDRPEVAAQKLQNFRKALIEQIREANDFYSPANGYQPYDTPGMKEILAPTPPAESPPSLGKSPATAGMNGGATPGAGDGTNGGGVAPVGATATTQDNPTLAGVRAEYKRRLGAGQSADDIIAWAKSAGIDASTYPSIRAQVDDFKRTKRPLSDYNTQQLDDMAVPLSSADQTMNAMGQSTLGAAGIAAGDTASMGTLDNIVGMTGGNAERARLGMDQVAQANPISSTIGSIAGGVGTALGLEAGLGARGIAGMARTLGADTLFGAGYGAGSTDYNSAGGDAGMSDRMIGGLKGAGLGLAGSYAGSKLAGGLAGMARGVATPAARTMQDAGAITTIGQKYGQSGRIGGAIKSVEDRLSGLPIVGDVINARRGESYTKFNSGAFDQALAPLSHVPELKALGTSVDGKVGAEAVADAHDKVQQAFSRALDGKSVTADRTGATDLTNSLMNAANLPRVGGEVNDSIAAILEPYMAPDKNTLTGAEMQTISQELRQLKAGYKTDPLKHRIGKVIDATEEAMFGMFRRQTPEVLPAYNAAKTAYRRVSILADSVNKALNQQDNLFTPAQLGQADRASTIKYEGPIAAAKGQRQFADYQQAGQEVLPNKVPDSGTAGRWLLPALAGIGGAGGAGVGYVTGDTAGGAATGLTLAAVLSGAYSKSAQRALIKAGNGVPNAAASRLLQSGRTGRAIQAGAATSAAALANQK